MLNININKVMLMTCKFEDTSASIVAKHLAEMLRYSIEWNISDADIHCVFHYRPVVSCLSELAHWMGATIEFNHDKKIVIFNEDRSLHSTI